MRVAYAVEDHDAVLAALADRVSPRVLRAPARLDVAARELDEYFAGTRRAFDLPAGPAALPRVPRARARRTCRRSATATRRSYAQVAAAAGNPQAVRAVGTACATNPLPVVVPCHRVVRSDGSSGGYVGGPDAKRALLTLEGVGGL